MSAMEIKKKSKKRRVALIAAFVALLGAALAGYVIFGGKRGADEFFTATVDRGAIRNAVSATGIVQAVLTVQVGSQVSGQILALYADYNSVVKRGQLLAKLDPRNYEAQLVNSKANLAASEARVRMVEADLLTQAANIMSAKANLEAARVTRDNAAVILGRYTDLMKNGIAAQNDFDTTKANFDSAAAKYNQAQASVEQVQAQLNSSKAQIQQAKAQVEQAMAELNRSQINLEYTDIISPVDGVVVSRSVDVGQTVAASLQAPTLFIIANDLTKMQVNASIDEADIGKISSKVDVKFTVDAYPNENFRGNIVEVRLNPQTLQNVVTYSVIIGVDNAQMKLKPGMTANITMTVDQRETALRVPNAAMRYFPSTENREKVMEEMRKQAQADVGGSSKETSDEKRGEEKSPSRVANDGTKSGKPPAVAGSPRAPQASAGPDLSGLSPEAQAIVKKMQDSDLGQDERRALFGEMRNLPDSDREKVRDIFRRMREEAEGGGAAKQAGDVARAKQPGKADDFLAPGQMWNPAEKIQFPAPRPARVRPALVWVLNKLNKPEKRVVRVGITDGVYSELVSGELKEGEKVIIGDTAQTSQNTAQGGTRSPFGQPVGGFGGRR